MYACVNTKVNPLLHKLINIYMQLKVHFLFYISICYVIPGYLVATVVTISEKEDS